MKRCLLSAFAVGLCMTANVMAQVPSYVPTNGLVAYWPFNGNANDESGNGNNGTVNGATLTTDRNGVANKAFSFDGIDDFIKVNPNVMFTQNPISFSFWFKKIGDVNCTWNNSTFYNFQTIFSQGSYGQSREVVIGSPNTNLFPQNNGTGIGISRSLPSSEHDLLINTNENLYNNWINIVVIYNISNVQLYYNSILKGTINFTGSIQSINNDCYIGKSNPLIWQCPQVFKGNLDDIGIWNRALTQQEITGLYNACSGNQITNQPSNILINIGSNAQFSINASTGNTYQWQNNPLNNGWQNVPENSTYSGSTTNTLTVGNVQLVNHNQPFRVIASNVNCVDTSNIATIQIADTCITNVTVYDTLLTTVTDTLIINTTLSLPAPNNENTILIYPNPASDHITIDNGNFTAMAGYSIKITNNAGQQVFQSAINQAQFYVDLSTWSGDGLYFVHLIDPQNNTVTVRKIVLQ